MPLVKVLGKGLVKFPDSMGPDQIKSALSSRFRVPRKVLDTNDFLYEFDPRALKATEQGKNIDDYKGDVTKPITVTQADSGFSILDGHHRAEIAKRDGKKIKAVVIPKDDVEEMASKGVHQGDMLKEWLASGGPKRNQGFTIGPKQLASAAPVAVGIGAAAQSDESEAGAIQKAVRAAFPDLKLDIREQGDNLIIDRIVVPESEREKGIGTAAINMINNIADQSGKQVALTPSADFGGNKKRLEKFYKRFGFVANKGRVKDFSVSESMIRPLSVGGAGLSSGALITPEQAEAANITPASTGTIEAARSPLFVGIANALRSVDTPIGKPFEGLADWAEGVAYQDDDKVKRAAIGALDLL